MVDGLDREKEKADLARAERDIANGEKRITAQMMLIDQLRADGRDTTEAEHLLAALQSNLAEWNEHRREILKVLEGLRSRRR